MPKVKLTKAIIDKIPHTSQGQMFLWDAELRGFGLCISRFSKTFVAQRDVNGRSRRVTLGRYGIITPDQARKGTGKGTFCRWLKVLFGQHGLQIFSADHISGRFNGHLQDCVLLFADEAIAPNDRNAEAILKGFLTEPTLPLERKGYDVVQVNNHLHVVMASNSDWVVPASSDERRFAVFEVSNEKIKHENWFEQINQEMESGGAEAMLYFLQNLELEIWHPRKNIPENSALTDQRIQSLRGPEKIWFNWLSTADTPCKLIDHTPCVPTTTFAELAHINVTAAGRFLSDMGFQKDENSRPRSWIAPQLKEARIIWNQKKFKVDWDDTEAWLGSAEPPF